MQVLIIYYNRLANYAFDICMAPLAALGRWAEILGVAAVLGIVVSLIFRRAGPQRTPAPSSRRVVGRPFRDLALPARALVGLAGATSIAQGQFAL